MKGSYKRFKQRERNNVISGYSQSMRLYEQTLDKLVKHSSAERVDDDLKSENYVFRLKPNTSYAIKCLDNNSYYRVVLIKKNELNNNYRVLVSNPVYGVIPDGMQEVKQEILFKQIKDMNLTLINTDLKAFPHNPYEGRYQ